MAIGTSNVQRRTLNVENSIGDTNDKSYKSKEHRVDHICSDLDFPTRHQLPHLSNFKAFKPAIFTKPAPEQGSLEIHHFATA